MSLKLRRWGAAALLMCGCAKGADRDAGTQLFPSDASTTDPFVGDDSSPNLTTSISGPDSDGGGETSDSGALSESGSANLCNNDGVKDPEEDCDTDDFDGLECEDIDPRFPTGTLACNDQCQVVSSGCFENPITLCNDNDVTIVQGGQVFDQLTFDMADVPGDVVDVEVYVDIQHADIGQLTLSIEHNGITASLYDEECDQEPIANLIGTFKTGVLEVSCEDASMDLEFPPLPEPDILATAWADVPVAGEWEFQIQDNTNNTDVERVLEWCVAVEWSE